MTNQTENTILVKIPFDGFYGSVSEMYIDNAIEYANSDADGEPLVDFDDLDIKYRPIMEAVSKHYVNAYNAVFKDEYGIDLGLEFKELRSPKFYNYSTDNIYCLMPPENSDKILDLLTGEQKVQAADETGNIYTHDALQILLPWQNVVENWQYADLVVEKASNAIDDDTWAKINAAYEAAQNN